MAAAKPRIGVTGGIGSGKSTVSQLFEAYGSFIIDADQIARSLTLDNGAAIDAIRQSFGGDFITASNALDRDKMRAAVFQQPAIKQQLEVILHPLIKRTIFEKYAWACKHSQQPLVIFDIPLLAESTQWSPRLDYVVVVDCSESIQISRVMARNQLAEDAVRAIMAQQATRAQRLRKADAVLWNETTSLQALGAEVQQLYNDLIAHPPTGL